MPNFPLLLAIDTCGPSGSLALGRIPGRDLEILGQTELAGRTYSATLVSAVADLLSSAGLHLGLLDAIIVVNGPGSFTGVRVGVSTAKGLAQGAGIPVVAISRLEVLSRKSGVPSAALDAHRGEVFLRLERGIDRTGRAPVELLAGPKELAAIQPVLTRVAVCDEGVAALLARVWPQTQFVTTPPPLASDALRLGEARLIAGAAIDLALLDGHYLRRSDAEIFGADVAAQAAAGVQIRRMTAADLDRVLAIAENLPLAPHWPQSAYLKAINSQFEPESTPRRIALVAAGPQPGSIHGFAVASLLPPRAELETIAVAPEMQRLGLGESLFQALAAELKAADVNELVLEVRASNRPALAFYRALGFIKTDRRPGYYADPIEDAILMSLPLAEKLS
jgi:tRNA threonylcarbamoyladenosine biosynthesis protein TsaB